MQWRTEWSKTRKLTKHNYYGSAAAYVQEVHKWSQSVRWCMAQQQMMASFWTTTFLQQQQTAMLMQQQQPQTIIVQQFEIPSFFRRIAAEAIDSVIMFVFKFFLVYTLVRADLIELDTFDSILTANADLQTLIDVTQGLFSVELLFKLVTAIIEALCITFGVPVGCTPGKRLLGIKVISCLDVQPVTGSPDRVAITGFAYVDFKRFSENPFETSQKILLGLWKGTQINPQLRSKSLNFV
uniref:RDD domain-containing protein n=1 Tax=Meloidogyne javanica TaxID=6303 RepID=A0A915MTK0_MELJA